MRLQIWNRKEMCLMLLCVLLEKPHLFLASSYSPCPRLIWSLQSTLHNFPISFPFLPALSLHFVLVWYSKVSFWYFLHPHPSLYTLGRENLFWLRCAGIHPSAEVRIIGKYFSLFFYQPFQKCFIHWWIVDLLFLFNSAILNMISALATCFPLF